MTVEARLPLTTDDEVVVAPQPQPSPDSLLARVLRSHPGLTPEEASEMLIAFGAHPDDDVGAIHAWRRSGQRAYERFPVDPEGDAQS